jgi:hypothetical protein
MRYGVFCGVKPFLILLGDEREDLLISILIVHLTRKVLINIKIAIGKSRHLHWLLVHRNLGLKLEY